MITHIVLFKLREDLSEKQRETAIEEIKVSLEQLPEKIEEIKKMKVVKNYKTREGGSDLALISEFENYEDLHKYQIHPEHLKTKEIIKKYKEFSIYVDYE